MGADLRTLAAEFPCDNPRLHAGVSWVCLSVTGGASAVGEPIEVVASFGELAVVDDEEVSLAMEAVLAPRESGILAISREVIPEEFSIEELLEDEAVAGAIVVEELEPLTDGVLVEGDGLPSLPSAETTILPPPVDAVDDSFSRLVDTLADVALAMGSPRAAQTVRELLVDGRLDDMAPVTELATQGLVDEAGIIAERLGSTARAWRSILAGTSEDYEACGSAMLDEWCADILARSMGAPARADALRKELRARGIAAFGLAA